MRLIQSLNLSSDAAGSPGLCWSREDDLAVISKRGILVYELINDPRHSQPGLNLRKDIIPSKTESSPHRLDVGLNINTVIEHLPKEEQYRFADLMFNYPNADNGRPAVINATQIEWAPREVVCSNVGDDDGREEDMALFVLNCDHWLRLFIREKATKNWVPQVDFTGLLRTSKTWAKFKANSSDIEIAQEVKSRMLSIAISKFCISETVKDHDTGINKFLLFTAQIDGSLCLWEMSSKISKMPVRLLEERQYDSGLGEISSMEILPISTTQHLLILGSCDGRAKALLVEWNGQDTPEIVSELFLWSNRDKSRVNAIHCSIFNSSVPGGTAARIVIAKETNFAAFELMVDKEAPMTLSKKKGSRIPPLDQKRTASRIIDIQSANAESLLLIFEKECPLVLNVDWDTMAADVKPHWDGPLEGDWTRYKCFGFKRSSGSALFAAVQNVSVFHDHLVLRTPMRISFYSAFDSTCMKRNLDAITDETIHLFKDSLEAFRSLSCASTSEIESGDNENLRKFFVDYEESLVKNDKSWKFFIWLLRLSSLKVGGKEDKLELALKRLFAVYAERSLNSNIQISERDNRLRNSFESFLSSMDEMRTISSRWSCTFCDQGSDQESALSVACKNGHTWPRCIISLEVCDAPNPFVCTWCDCYALPQYCLGSRREILCTLCNGPMKLEL